jgi:hypothetical protein
MTGYRSKVEMSDSRDSSDGEFFISRQEWDGVVLRAQLELQQRVNRLVELLESEYGEREARKLN